jgi:hypothetical protein
LKILFKIKNNKMMTLKTKIIAPLSIGLLLGMAACGSPDSIYDLDTAGEIDEIKKEIVAAAGDIMTYEVSLSSLTELETSLSDIEIVTNADAAEGTLMKHTYDLKGETEASVSVIDSEFSVRVYNKNEPKKLSEIDFGLIEKNIEAAKSQIPAVYIDHSVYEYRIQFDDNKRADSFIINCLEEGESDHMEGRDIVTNYYEFLFEMDENGAVIMLEG